MKYYVGAGYTYQDGLIDHVKDKLEKYSVNTKLQINAKKWLKINFNNNLSISSVVRPMAKQTFFYGTIANQFPTQTTVLPVDGEYNIPSWNMMMF
ncbi:hypothetical protein EVA_17940 [gut metagenome]|uniref:Uncharacterized protein n=1 Tax=gut metagenome TaxID=749906 RepID=J9FWK8_9ZZZZ